MHASQRTILENIEQVQIEMELYLTLELTMIILSYGAGVKVVAPEKLRKEIADCISKLGEKYKGRN